VVFLAIALVGAGSLAFALHGRPGVSSSAPQKAQRVVIFLIDGASAFPASSMPVAAGLARSGTAYDRAFIGQWPGTRPASGATVGMGVFPRAHGVEGASWRDPSTGLEVQPTAPDAVRLGSLDQLLESRKLTPIAAVLKDRNPESKVLAVGGVGCAPADAAGSWLADYAVCIARQGNRWVERAVTGHDLPSGSGSTASVPVANGRGLGPEVEGWQLGGQDDQIAQNAVAAIRATKPALTIVDFPEVAAVAAFAPAAQRQAVINKLLAGIDQDIGQIRSALRARRLLTGTAFVVTSGEALSPLDHTERSSAFSDAVVAAGGVPVFVHGGGSAAIAIEASDQAQTVAQAIEQAQPSGVDAVFYRVQHGGSWRFEPQYVDPLLRPSYGDALSALVSSGASAEAPDVVAVYAPHTGTRIAVGPLTSTSVSGGFSWDTQHIPLIVSGAGVVAGQASHYPARLVDIAPTVESLLGLTPAAGDGVVLANALQNPPGGSVDRQQARQQTLAPVVNALIERLHSAG
jgi:hypothetical protein